MSIVWQKDRDSQKISDVLDALNYRANSLRRKNPDAFIRYSQLYYEVLDVCGFAARALVRHEAA